MANAASAKELLRQFNKEQYQRFSLNDDDELSLPAVSSVPWIGAAKRTDLFKKIRSHKTDNHVRFITKNDEPYSFLWQTNNNKLKEAVRWGIIKPESVSGRVIAALGQYRVVAHERIAKSMTSNTQSLKLKLLNIYQDRFEAIQDLESLVNKDNSKEDYNRAITAYIKKMELIRQNLSEQLQGVGLEKIGPDVLSQIKFDIHVDIKRAKDYLKSINEKTSLRANNRARGYQSIQEFVKQQLLHNLYELQGINQDITYSAQRSFALTRGELNDFIEDARKEIDDYRSDPRNAITASHHGNFVSHQENGLLTYDFSRDDLSANRQRQVLLAISFIEGWDKVDYSLEKPVVSNESGTETLKTITASRWQTHANIKVLLKSYGLYLFNIIKGIFVETKPWEEKAWKNKNFHLVAASLRKNVIAHEPMWLKPVSFLKQIGYALIDMFNGIKDFGSNLVIKMPDKIVNDWHSTSALPDFDQVFKQVEQEIVSIKTTENFRLNELLKSWGGEEKKIACSPAISELARFEYHLTPGEQNDILTAMVRGVDSFASFFTHNIFAKDPIAGLLFTTTYAIGGAAIFFPAFSAAIFGATYVNWFTQFSYTMGASKFAATIAGGSTQAQLFASAWDVIMHGPSSMTAETVAQLAEDPLTVGAYFGLAYGIGYVLANGVAGHPIPWLSEALKGDLGTAPETGYPLIGAKVGISLHEAFLTPSNDEFHPHQFTYNGTELDYSKLKQFNDSSTIINRFFLAQWLSRNAEFLPKLESRSLYYLSRHIEEIFSKEEAMALKKLLYPESNPSIAFQAVSIPLMYIPAVLRLVTSVGLSLVAWVMGSPHPARPVKQAGGELIDRTARDLNRLIIFTYEVIRVTYNCLASLVKMLVYTGDMTIGRLLGRFNLGWGHATHSGFADSHGFFRTLGEFFYPARATKSVVVAHPGHVIRKSEESYAKLIQLVAKGHQESIDQNLTEQMHSALFTNATSDAFIEKPWGFLIN